MARPPRGKSPRRSSSSKPGPRTQRGRRNAPARASAPSAAPGASEKLQKVLAAAGVGSRREIEGWIASGRISVNGETAHLGQRVNSEDVVYVDGRRVSLKKMSQPQILILNKSGGTVCSRKDPEGRASVFDQLPALRNGRWVSVGRLDMQTTGLLLMTNDGALANKMMHPSTGLDREYAARIDRPLDEQEMAQLKAGVQMDGETLRFSDIQHYDGTERNVWYHVALLEGKNREVRRLFEAVGANVTRLKRVRYGPVILPSWLRVGQWSRLRNEDIEQLYKLLKVPFDRRSLNSARDARTVRQLAKSSCLIPYPDLAD